MNDKRLTLGSDLHSQLCRRCSYPQLVSWHWRLTQSVVHQVVTLSVEVPPSRSVRCRPSRTLETPHAFHPRCWASSVPHLPHHVEQVLVRRYWVVTAVVEWRCLEQVVEGPVDTRRWNWNAESWNWKRDKGEEVVEVADDLEMTTKYV